jgi:hypothetical protein
MLSDLTEAQKFALTALLEVQPADTVGDFVGETDEGDYVTSYRFETTLPGYPGWNWTVTIADLPDEHPTVVESELLPIEGALLAPDWIPWSERMDEYRAAQLALGEQASDVGGLDDDDPDDDDQDDDDDDADDDDDEDIFGSDNLHGGDLDGVDIDEFADLAEVPEPVEGPDSNLGSLDLQVDQANEPEPEGDGGSENPPRVPARRKRSGKKQQDEQGD